MDAEITLDVLGKAAGYSQRYSSVIFKKLTKFTANQRKRNDLLERGFYKECLTLVSDKISDQTDEKIFRDIVEIYHNFSLLLPCDKIR